MSAQPPPGDRHLWEYQAVRDVALLLSVAGVVWLIIATRTVTLPIAVGLALAYAVNPIVRWISRRNRIARWASTALLLLGFALTIAVVLLIVVPTVVHQVSDLVHKLPAYGRTVSEKLNIDWQATTSYLREYLPTQTPGPDETPPEGGAPADPQPPAAPQPVPPTVAPDAPPTPELGAGLDDSLAPRPPGTSDAPAPVEQLFTKLGPIVLRIANVLFNVGYDVVSSAISFTTYLMLFLLVVTFCFFFFSVHFDRIVRFFAQFVPVSRRDRVNHIARRMDRTVAAFLRGRLIQALVFGSVLSVGWWIAGVPYWLLLGMLCGVLNLIPYAAAVGWPAAVALAWVASVSPGGEGFSVAWVLIAPSAVYLLAQAVDGWAVEPLVQGQATGLDPLTVLLAVLIGASLAGLLGMILAIPVAACVKILGEEEIVPRFRAWAERS